MCACVKDVSMCVCCVCLRVGILIVRREAAEKADRDTLLDGELKDYPDWPWFLHIHGIKSKAN